MPAERGDGKDGAYELALWSRTLIHFIRLTPCNRGTALSEQPQGWKPEPPPGWLLYLFVAITGGLTLQLAAIESAAILAPLIAANVIVLVWDVWASRA